MGSRAPRRASCRAAAEPRGRQDLVGVLDLVSFGNCRWHVESVLPADVVRSAIAHDEIDVALNDVERQGGHLQSILTLVFHDGLDPGGDSSDGTVLVERKSNLLEVKGRAIIESEVVQCVGRRALHTAR